MRWEGERKKGKGEKLKEREWAKGGIMRGERGCSSMTMKYSMKSHTTAAVSDQDDCKGERGVERGELRGGREERGGVRGERG